MSGIYGVKGEQRMDRVKGDLHIHTTVSDCNYSIEEVVAEAVRCGVTHMAITDHDTVAGNKRAVKAGEKYGIMVSPGIEISAFDYKRNKKAHLLGYNVTGEEVTKLCNPLLEMRNNTSKKMHKVVGKKGYDVSWKDITRHAGETGVFKQHIMLALIERGYTDRIYGDLYRSLFKGRGEANIPLEYPDIFDAVKAVKDEGGIAVLAHPAQLKNEDIISELAENGLDGIEVYHPDHTESDVERLLKIASEHNLLVSGGSDFHGNMGNKWIELGSYEPCEDILDRIFKENE